jgi:hypothetical protein
MQGLRHLPSQGLGDFAGQTQGDKLHHEASKSGVSGWSGKAKKGAVQHPAGHGGIHGMPVQLIMS